MYTIQTSTDRGYSWTVTATQADDTGTTEPQQLAADVLDRTYRELLENADAHTPIPLLQVQVACAPTGPVVATSSIGTDRQWEAAHDLLAEIAADIEHFEELKKEAEAEAAGHRSAITHAKQRLASVTRSAIRMRMPQVDIAHGAGRSRERVRRIQDTVPAEDRGPGEA